MYEQPPTAQSAGACEQPPVALLQVVGPHVAGVAGACEQPPAASLQVVGLHVQQHDLYATVGNHDQYATVGSEPLVTAAGALSPSRVSISNFGEYARLSMDEFMGVAHGKSTASSLAGAWNQL